MLLLSFLIACGGSPSTDGNPQDTQEVIDTGTPWPDGGCEGTDEDKDGWCLEEGDCDDTNEWVNPGRDEDKTDGIDNDCDGRVDESFKGLTLMQVGSADEPHRILGIDPLGKEEFSIDLDNRDVVPYFLTAGVGGGWVVADLAEGFLMQVDETGHVTPLSDFSESEFGMYGITTHPDGYYLVSVIGGLIAVDPATGVQTTLVEWVPDEVGFFAFDMSVNYATGDVGVSGYYGAFGVLSAGGEWTTHRLTDMEADPQYIMYSSDHRDSDGFYAGAFLAENGEFGVYRFDMEQNDWVKKASWSQEWSPHFLAVDSESGDFFITTDGGQYPYAWKIDGETGAAASFYPDAGTIQPGISYWDLYANY
jgi:hypothetical protein